LKEGNDYIFSFRAKGAKPRSVGVALGESKAPYKPLGLSGDILVGPEWNTYRMRFRALASDPDAKIQFNLGSDAGSFTLADAALEPATGDPTGKDPADWKLQVQSPSVAAMTIPSSAPNAVRVAPTQVSEGKEMRDVMLVCPGLKFKAGQRGKFSFRARSDKPREISVTLIQAHPPWTPLGFSRSVELDDKWRQVAGKFTCSIDEPNGQIQFNLGGVAIPVEIADVLIEPVDESDPSRFDPMDWELSAQGGNRASLEFPPNPKGSLRVNIASVDDSLEPWRIRIARAGAPVRANQKYTLQFKARSDKPRSVILAVNQSRPPFRQLGLYRTITLKPEVETYQVRFEPDMDDPGAKIEFSAGHSDVDFDLWDFSLESAEEISAAPPRGPSTRLNLIFLTSFLSIAALWIFWRSRKAAGPAGASG
jgi:hypothetical protein